MADPDGTASDPDTTPSDSDADTAPSDPETPDPDPYDHLRPTDPGAAGVDSGVYRVVGAGDPVALLRVGEADGRRVNSGEVVAVDRDALAAFEPVPNPDGNRPPSELVTGALSSLGWQLRAFVGGLRANPVLAAAALAVFLAGQFGEGRLPGPDSLPAVLVIAGALGLAYAGSRGSR